MTDPFRSYFSGSTDRGRDHDQNSKRFSPLVKRVVMIVCIIGVVGAALMLGNTIEKHDVSDCTVEGVSDPIMLRTGGTRFDVTFDGCPWPIGEKTARLSVPEGTDPAEARPEIGVAYDLVVSEGPVGGVDIVSISRRSG